MPKTYRCIKVFTVNSIPTFTEGKLYQGKIYYRDGKGDIEAEGVSFTNDQGHLHLLPFDWLDKYFVQVPELDIMSHDELHRWLTDHPSPRQLYQAIITGREWLENFKPEMEDDEGLMEAVKERLEMIEAAYELVGDSGMEPPK
jgi:hypothetical protein